MGTRWLAPIDPERITESGAIVVAWETKARSGWWLNYDGAMPHKVMYRVRNQWELSALLGMSSLSQPFPKRRISRETRSAPSRPFEIDAKLSNAAIPNLPLE